MATLKQKDNLTKKEKEFANEYLSTGNGTQSALKVYDTKSENVAGTIAFQNLRKLKIQEYIESHAEDAQAMIYTLSQGADNEAVRLNASKDIMDRAGYKPVDRTQSTSLNVNVDVKNEDKSELDAIRDEYENKLKRSLYEKRD